MTALLAAENVECRFGGVTALADVGLEIHEGRTIGLIGPNGAGKSTLLNCITGYYRPSRGQIKVDGRAVVGSSPQALCRLGVSRTFQNLALFGPQSVRDNVVFGAYQRFSRRRLWHRREVDAELDRVLVELDLADLAGTPVAELPYATRKRVEFARALMARPRLLLLDEPTSGMGIDDSRAFSAMLDAARQRSGLTVVVVAHDMAFVFRTCELVYVLDAGRIIFQGPPEAVREDAEVRRVYLGSRA